VGKIPHNPAEEFEDIGTRTSDLIVEVIRWQQAMSEERPHRLGGPGPTTSRQHQRRQARGMFLGALCRLKPELSAELWSSEVDTLMDAAWTAGTNWSK
jgi:hypothetical protein